LLFHAIASEVAQHYGALWFNTRRTGKVADVAIDTVGILLGFAVVAWFLRVKSRRNSVPTESSIQDHVRA
jgi:VanZ family protein